MSRDSKRINFSVHPDIKSEIDEVMAELKNRSMGYSGVICKLLIQFGRGGFVFKDGVK